MYIQVVYVLWTLITSVLTQHPDNKTIKITSLYIQTEIKLRFATTLVTTVISNPEEYEQKFPYDISLPSEAFLSRLVLEVNGIIHKGLVKGKDKRTKAEQSGTRSKTNKKYTLELRIDPLSKVTVNTTFQQLLQRNQGRYEHVLYYDPAYTLNEFTVDIAIRESRPITHLSLPGIPNVPLSINEPYSTDNLVVVQPRTNVAYVRYKPDLGNMNMTLPGYFPIQYDIERRLDAGDIIVVGNYFAHFFAPVGLQPIPKDIVFILDKSGSMAGNRIAQLKTVMKLILKDLQMYDRFEIIVFESDVEFRAKVLELPTNETLQTATEFVNQIETGGGTNILDALVQGILFLNKYPESNRRSKIIIFLTDGMLEGSKKEVLSKIRAINTRDIPIFSLSFGDETDYDFLQQLSYQNHGVARKIFDGVDADLQIRGFYDDVSVTLLKDVNFTYPEEVNTDNTTQSSFSRYFNGSELLVAGQLLDETVDLFNLTVDSSSFSGDLTFEASTQVLNSKVPVERGNQTSVEVVPSLLESYLVDRSQARGITEKIWAYKVIKQSLERLKIEKVEEKDVQDNLMTKALDLSLQYNFLTPLTTLVVDDKEEMFLRDEQAEILPPSRRQTDISRKSTRRPARGPARYGGAGDPHFIAKVPDVELPFCFDVPIPADTIIRLVEDPAVGFILNAGIVECSKGKRCIKRKTYITEIFILCKKFNIVVTTSKFVFQGNVYTWSDILSKRFDDVDVTGNLIRFNIDNDTAIEVQRKLQKSGHPMDYLNIALSETHGLSKKADGLLGQFKNKRFRLVRVEQHPKKVVGRFRGYIYGKVQHFRAKLKTKHDFTKNAKFSCWQLRNAVQSHIIHRKIEKYRVPTLFSRTFIFNND